MSSRKRAKDPLPPSLVAVTFEARGLALRPGQGEVIAATMGKHLAKLRQTSAQLPLEAEPARFLVAEVAGGKAGRR